MKKTIYSLVFLATAVTANAQEVLIGPTISYQTQAGNLLKIGGYYVQPILGNDIGFRLDANAQFAYFRNRFLVIPEGGVTIYPTFDNTIIPFAKGEITPYTLTPKVGLSVATIVDFAIGYGFDIKTKEGLKPLEGFTFSVGINIPLNILL